MESRVEQFTRGFFWVGYGVFLLASIPHIAAYFRHYDPNEANIWADSFWWLIAYAIAVVIDLSDVLISIAVMRAMARGEKFGQLWGYWLFIAFIMALSWLFNWQYNVVYETNTFAAADALSIFRVSLKTINPIIGSAFQILLLVYTAMAHKFAQKPVEKTAVQLAEEAKEMEEKDVQIARIEVLKKVQKDRRREGFIDSVKQAKDSALKVVKGEEKQSNPEPVKPVEVVAQSEEKIDEKPEERTQENNTISEEVSDVRRKTKPLENLPETDAKMSAVSSARPQKRYTIAEAAKLPICQKKGIVSSDIKSAILAGKLEKKPDGKLAKTAVESWVRAFKKDDEKLRA